MSRPGALATALAALVASGTAAQTPRYEGVRLEAVAAESPSWTGGARGGGPDDRRARTERLAPPDLPPPPPGPPPVQGEDFLGPAALARGPFVADTTSAPPDEWLGRDKAFHAGGSFLLTLGGQYLLVNKHGLSEGQALPVSAATALALGLVKEVSDSRRARDPLFSWRDLAADAAGVALAALVVGL